MQTKSEGPAAGATANGPSGIAYPKAPSSTKARRQREAITARVRPDGQPITVEGREAQTLALLISTGPAGFTSGEASPLGWARRTSDYVFKLRARGVPIATTMESTPDGARVARYALTAPMEVVARGGVQ